MQLQTCCNVIKVLSMQLSCCVSDFEVCAFEAHLSVLSSLFLVKNYYDLLS